MIDARQETILRPSSVYLALLRPAWDFRKSITATLSALRFPCLMSSYRRLRICERRIGVYVEAVIDLTKRQLI